MEGRNGGCGGPADRTMDHPQAWTMTVELYASSFEFLQSAAKGLLGEIAAAKNYKELPSSAGGGGGGDPVGTGYTVKWRSPIEWRIAQLRKEADELEASLRGKAT